MTGDTAVHDIWADDLLNRREDGRFLQSFLSGRVEERKARGLQASYVVNIDGRWGAGKTFFVERFAAQLSQAGYIVARVDAWKDDHTDEPFIAVLAAIDEALLPFTTKKGTVRRAWDTVKKGAAPILGRALIGAGKTLVRRYVGTEVKELIASIDGEDTGPVEEAISEGMDKFSIEVERVVDEASEKLIAAFTAKRKAIDDFRDRLSKAVAALGQARSAPLFVIIDELDRCRPSYAVALLERVKHLFEVDNIVFVFATNTDQLQHSVSGAYGPGFDGFRYLTRFFERTYQLQAPSVDQFISVEAQVVPNEKLTAPGGDLLAFLTATVKAYKMDLREIRQFLDIVGSVATVWEHRMLLDILTLAALAICYMRTGSIDWEDAERNIPDYRVAMGFSRRNNQGDRVPVELTVRRAFETMRSVTGEIRHAIQLGDRDGMSTEQRYVYEVLSPEWNGTGIPGNSPSVIRQLGLMIANAGRLVQDFGNGPR